ncbi:hypothetical protein GOP47_0018364 [Adiantum capillus-veneris]|uniref:Undecaprenyldiphospho-muramoylpentapeptide beta-N-acetylglucosaminyltransferase n=1 Tax=Adiantum capillus-veneris TaxID=13818 RepID=A0A9D4UH61_ADICA|nr:hypothetical protein GOP47_0018364 [Adiantum capillus-veneris]
MFMGIASNNADGLVEDPAVSARVMFAAGGTGGHVFPAIAIADALTIAHKSVTVQFLGTRHRLEASAVPRAGYTLRHIPAVPLRRPIFLSPQNLLLPFRLILSIAAALQLLLAFRPHVVVGTGGYISGPICFAALLCGCPFVIQEQNVCPGLANKILASFATSVFVAFADALVHFPSEKCIVSGNPVRWTLQQLVLKRTALRHFFPSSILLSDEATQCDDEHCEIVFIQGGSLGAKSLNQAVIGFAEEMLEKHPKRFLIWQTGPKHFKGVLNKLRSHERLFICEFLLDMNLAYSAADLVVACSGAITCSELLNLGKPSILIPLQYVADNHQRNNAAVLERAGAARILDDVGLTPEKLEGAINELLGDKAILASMCKNALKIATPSAADLIAQEVFLLAWRHASRRVTKKFQDVAKMQPMQFPQEN